MTNWVAREDAKRESRESGAYGAGKIVGVFWGVIITGVIGYAIHYFMC